MTVILWIIAGLCGVMFVLNAAFNYWCVIEGIFMPGKPHTPAAGMKSAKYGIMALVFAPLGTIGQRLHYAWVPLVFDIGIVLSVVCYVACVIEEQRERPDETP